VRRVVIENVRPEIQGGRFPIKRTIGEPVEVTADVYADGHDIVHSVLLHRPLSRRGWEEVPMQPLVNDRWQAKFIVSAEGIHLYTLQGWVDPFQSWSRDFSKSWKPARTSPWICSRECNWLKRLQRVRAEKTPN